MHSLQPHSPGPAEEPLAAINLTNVAGVYFAQGRLKDAEHLFRQAVELFERVPEHVGYANCLDKFAELLRKTNRTAEAQTLSQRSNAVRETLLANRGQRGAVRTHW